MSTELSSRKVMVGIVTSDAMDKTVAVQVERTVLDPQFKKYIRRKKRFLAHDEKNECACGDIVEIRESRPLSKRKRWRVTKLLKKALLPREGLA